jgi:hypothetical protein
MFSESQDAPVSIEKLMPNQFRLELPPKGGTFIGIVRNVDDYRGKPKQIETLREAGIESDQLAIGHLMPAAEKAAEEFGEEQFSRLLDDLTEEQRRELDILVVASDTKIGFLATPDGSRPHPYQRCVDTAHHILEGVKKVMEKSSLRNEQLLNRNFHKTEGQDGSQPVAIRDLEDIKIKGQDEETKVAEYFAFLKDEAARRTKEGQSSNMWVLYEKDDDVCKEKRTQLGIQGPVEISNRMQNVIERAKRIAQMQHQRNPNRRLVVLAVAPRDVVGPWLNIHNMGLPTQGNEIPNIEPLGGVGISIDPQEQTQLVLGENKYPIKDKLS